MTKRSLQRAWPDIVDRKERKGEFMLWLDGQILPPEEAYAIYAEWMKQHDLPQSRHDINVLCGEEFNISHT